MKKIFEKQLPIRSNPLRRHAQGFAKIRLPAKNGSQPDESLEFVRC
jgi:hypothetical protein